MIKFALVCLNSTGATNLYVLSNSTTMDTEEIKNRLSKVPVKLLLNYIIDAERGQLITRFVFAVPESFVRRFAA
ncbi:hypothetical protein OTK01_000419 [Caldicellulosiruptor acetigenus]|uniref:hypothetical protein n=1 Tax=Caldicellulosiruptor acetigenus TaxID=301953 RepID=UPI0022A9528C|nr:hypothetical protein [Caldicellulosiruptor acetigenus]WAM36642.1 hypothetical protein OTK01_000419 [Caldicellulosiruptor acetigenus]